MTARAIRLRGVDGSWWDLTNGPVQAGQDPALWGLPSVEVTERQSANLPGSRVMSRRHAATDLIVPLVMFDPVSNPMPAYTPSLLIDGFDVSPIDTAGISLIDGRQPFTPTTLEEVVARFARALDPVRGDVTVVVQRADGQVREITATYTAGYEGLTHTDHTYGWIQGSVALRAMDPYWMTVKDETMVVSPPAPVFTSGTTPFSDPATGFDALVPFDGFLINDALFDDPNVLFDDPTVGFSGTGDGVRIFTLANDGDVDAWPRFQVVGPVAVVEADNVGTGKTWRLDDLAAGEVLQIDTQPGEVSVAINGVNAFGRLRTGSKLWSLAPGANAVAVRVDGTGDGSAFAMRWRPRYLTC